MYNHVCCKIHLYSAQGQVSIGAVGKKHAPHALCSVKLSAAGLLHVPNKVQCRLGSLGVGTILYHSIPVKFISLPHRSDFMDKYLDMHSNDAMDIHYMTTTVQAELKKENS